MEHDGSEEISRNKSHGRHEERYTTVIDDPPGLPPEWPDVAAVVLVGRERGNRSRGFLVAPSFRFGRISA